MQILFVSHSWIKTFLTYGVKPNPGFVERQYNSKPRKLMLDNNSSWCLSPSSLSHCSPTWSIPPEQYPSSSPHFTLLWGSLTCSLLPLNEVLTPVPPFQSPTYSGLALFFIALYSCQGGLFILLCICNQFSVRYLCFHWYCSLSYIIVFSPFQWSKLNDLKKKWLSWSTTIFTKLCQLHQ